MLAVTTRNKLRSRRFFAPMLYASAQVRRQLADTPGIVRFTTGISGLTEFYTLTIWESKTAMFQFTGSGNHRQMMWLFTRWSDSFWSMRWLPTAVLAHIPSRSLKLWQRLRHLLHAWQASRALLRFKNALSIDGYFHLSLWHAWAEEEMMNFIAKLTDYLNEGWMMQFRPGNYEIGNWDGMRLRYLARQQKENF